MNRILLFFSFLVLHISLIGFAQNDKFKGETFLFQDAKTKDAIVIEHDSVYYRNSPLQFQKLKHAEYPEIISRYNSFSAEEGKNDDLTICLVLFAWISTQEYFKEMTETDIRKRLREEHEKELEENDSTPFGFVSSSDSLPNEIAELYDNYLGAERDSDGNLWYTKEDDDYSYFWNYNYR